MDFFLGSPGYIWGALAALIPLVLHMERRRSARTVPFTMLRFLMEVERKRFLNMRLMEMLLLLLRMLTLALIAIALASPTFTWTGDAPFFSRFLVSEGTRAKTIVLLDTSYSMAGSGPSGAPWDRAMERIRETVERHLGEAPISIYPFSQGLDRPAPGLAPVPIEPGGERALERLAPIHLHTDVPRAFIELADRLGGLRGRDILVLTDLQRNSWIGVDSLPPEILSGSRITVVDLAEEIRPNVWVERIEMAPLSWGREQEEVFKVYLRATGLPAGREPEVQVHLTRTDGTPIQSRGIALRPETHTVLEWTVRPREDDVFSAILRVEPGHEIRDSHLHDNEAFFSIPVLQEVHAALIGPGNSLSRNMIEIGLAPFDPSESDRGFLFTHGYSSIEAMSGDWSRFDLIVLHTPPGFRLDGERLDRLEEYVSRGGGLLIVLEGIGDVRDPENLESLQRISGIVDTLKRFGIEAGKALPFPSPAEIVWRNASHPIFQAIQDVPEAAYRSVRIYSCLFLKQVPNRLLAISHSLAGGDESASLLSAPLLVGGEFGMGRVLCLTTGLDPGSSNLGATSLLVPLLDACLKYLAMGSDIEIEATGERCESDFRRLSPEEQRKLETAVRNRNGGTSYGIEFVPAGSLGRGLPVRSHGGSAAALFLFLAVGAALTELWLANLSF